MSRGLNRVMLIGHLGADPEIKYLPNGSAVVNITVATGAQWKDKETGDQKEATEWHRVVAFQKLAEIIGEYCRKGGQVYVEGRLQTRKWTNKDGVDVYTTEIIADRLDMLGARPQERPADRPQQPQRPAQRPAQRSAHPAAKSSTTPRAKQPDAYVEGENEDIPFDDPIPN